MNVREYVRVKEAEWNKDPVRRDNRFIPTFCEVVWLSFIQIFPGKEKRSATRPAFIVVLPLLALSPFSAFYQFQALHRNCNFSVKVRVK